jgi:hypothetical protein
VTCATQLSNNEAGLNFLLKDSTINYQIEHPYYYDPKFALNLSLINSLSDYLGNDIILFIKFIFLELFQYQLIPPYLRLSK